MRQDGSEAAGMKRLMNSLSAPFCLAVGLLVAGCQEPGNDRASSGNAESGAVAFRAVGVRNTFTPGGEGMPDMSGVYCSGQPTPDQFRALAESGVRRVISLRKASENGAGFEEDLATSAGIEFVRMPIDGKTDITVDNAKQLAELVADGSKPVVVACGSSNRVGALFALKAHFVDGLPADKAMQFGRDCGMTRLEPVVQQLLSGPR